MLQEAALQAAHVQAELLGERLDAELSTVRFEELGGPAAVRVLVWRV